MGHLELRQLLQRSSRKSAELLTEAIRESNRETSETQSKKAVDTLPTAPSGASPAEAGPLSNMAHQGDNLASLNTSFVTSTTAAASAEQSRVSSGLHSRQVTEPDHLAKPQSRISSAEISFEKVTKYSKLVHSFITSEFKQQDFADLQSSHKSMSSS